MKVYGIDFTSAPRKGKPITCAVGHLAQNRLTVEEVWAWERFEPFEQFLSDGRPALCGVDFPFGQPRRLIEALGWPDSWHAYVHLLQGLGKTEFVEVIRGYCRQQPAGHKHHLRRTDALAGACSPMMLYGVPVGKMFFEGSPRLANSSASILPCRPNRSARTVVEAYPALVARQANKPYKSHKQADRLKSKVNRRQLLASLQTEFGYAAYGLELVIADALPQTMIDDPTGDRLDALLCTLQVASAYLKYGESLGIPPDADPAEGWIVDPHYADSIE